MMIITRMKKILKISILLAFLLLIGAQVLNIRSPISIKEAMACGNARVYGTVYQSNGYTKLPGATVQLTKPGGGVLTTISATNGGFSFVGDVTALPNGSYSLAVSKTCYKSVTKGFSLAADKGASATVKMVQCSSGNSSSIALVFFPWIY